MQNSILDSPIEYLKGVGPQRGEVLKKELGIFTFKQLLFHLPFRYIDRTVFNKVSEIPDIEGYVQLKGRLVVLKKSGMGRSKRLTARFEDQSGYIDLIWFAGINFIETSLKLNQEVIVFGKAKRYGASWNIAHPDLDFTNAQGEDFTYLMPVYSSTEKATSMGLHSKGIAKLIRTLWQQLETFPFDEDFPELWLHRAQLISFDQAIRLVHFPKNQEEAQTALKRLKFDELFYLQLELLLRKQIGKTRIKSFVFEKIGETFNYFYQNNLPFELTNAQKKVIKEIRADFASGTQMNRLLQGDVGSGKTMVALLTMLIAVGNGYQAALMAPTEILAQQHYEGIRSLLQHVPVQVKILTGSSKTAERKSIMDGLLSGEVDLLIGTHALIEPKVKFKNLGFVVIDEQHRFGVEQRRKLQLKNTLPPHVLVMTATPIPRTLALSFYGDLDVSVIDELPPGRKPIKTVHYKESQRLKVLGFLADQIAIGRQVYVVYPLIQESETLDYQNLMTGYESLVRSFPLPKYQISIVHGKMKAEDKDYEMARFVKGETQIMVATTVIEVGVNVPNASVMVIESSERFGLAQLHQLRGRVGRGAEQSFCILMTGNKLSQESKKRVKTMCETNDGFVISEVDLEMRGPGNIMGTQQSGLVDLKIADLARDGSILTLARKVALAILEQDPNLNNPQFAKIRAKISKILKSKPDWSRIS